MESNTEGFAPQNQHEGELTGMIALRRLFRHVTSVSLATVRPVSSVRGEMHNISVCFCTVQVLGVIKCCLFYQSVPGEVNQSIKR